ncbi:putative zinc-binding metallopeptidase [Ketogulonicigenium vulgare]|nr:putative zinc-binding metallopeptidase [Ketogulonicigenium vulgare]ALJ82674.1 hypothetical protein KVH_15060 [Ketogulonicigenium vulgare]ANW35368.1 hypothetical protein KvSKV_14950 [Ketogulonicigenium vulgare]AOZ53286.1 hypothetical protein KVC_0260 [Ketogulonicigenium vulgare]
MQYLACPACHTRVFPHNTECTCGAALTFDPEQGIFVADGLFCARRAEIDCNWIAEDGGLCRACAMTRAIPDLSVPENIVLLTESERAKRWMLINLARWGWFTAADTGPRPIFDMLSEMLAVGATQVTMGHANGVITINVMEADPTTRVERQHQLGELYRSMLGHMRHEMAHFLFARLAALPGFLDAFRALFGDERADYAAAIAAHYEAPKDPGADYISAYATMHPHEDWAESAAHVLHLTDLTDSFMAVRLSGPQIPAPGYDAYAEHDGEALLTAAAQVAIAVNEINRALDNPDVYPFILTPRTREKLAFVHHYLSQGARMA